MLYGYDHNYTVREIEVWDDMGRMLKRLSSDGSGGGPLDVQFAMSPDPAVPGSDLSVSLDFSDPINFQPKVVFEFEDGSTWVEWGQGAMPGQVLQNSRKPSPSVSGHSSVATACTGPAPSCA